MRINQGEVIVFSLIGTGLVRVELLDVLVISHTHLLVFKDWI